MRKILQITALWEVFRFLLVSAVIITYTMDSFIDLPLLFGLFWAIMIYIPYGVYIVSVSKKPQSEQQEGINLIMLLKSTQILTGFLILLAIFFSQEYFYTTTTSLLPTIIATTLGIDGFLGVVLKLKSRKIKED